MKPFIQRRDSGVFTFIVSDEKFTVTADSPIAAMAEINRREMSKLGSFAWIDHPDQPNTWYAVEGNFFD
jgi:hypothetical protein